jgi:hypothetical protein
MFYPLVRLGVASCLILVGQVFALPKYTPEGKRAFSAGWEASDRAGRIANYKRAAELDFPKAWTELAGCYLSEPTPEQEKRGVGFLWEGVKRGHADAVESLAHYYWRKKQPERLVEIARQYYGINDPKVIERRVARWIIEIDNEEGIARLAKKIDDSNNTDREAVRILLRSIWDREESLWAGIGMMDSLVKLGVSMGIPEATRHLGEQTLSGSGWKGVKRDEQEGLRLLRAAAEAGDEEACLSLIVHFGHADIQPDEVRRWLLWGAERKMWEVSHRLAGAYKEGEFGFAVDSKSALQWWTAAAEAGHENAAEALRDWYGERGDERRAEYWSLVARYGPPGLKREPFMGDANPSLDRFVR